MILIGMFDSPFVRRVAVSMNLLGMAFEHRNWSVGKDFDRIREFNPLGRVPTLVLPDGEALIESAAILDYLDDLQPPGQALLPRSGAARRDALQIVSIATGVAEKGVLQIYENAFRPADKYHPPWVERCRVQMHAGLAQLEVICAQRHGQAWLLGSRLSQPDVTVACILSFLNEALDLRSAPELYPALRALTARCEALPAFAAINQPQFSPPAPRSTR